MGHDESYFGIDDVPILTSLANIPGLNYSAVLTFTSALLHLSMTEIARPLPSLLSNGMKHFHESTEGPLWSVLNEMNSILGEFQFCLYGIKRKKF